MGRALRLRRIPFAVLAAAPNLAVAVAVATVAGAASMTVLSGATTVVTLQARPEMRGRILTLSTVVSVGSIPLTGLFAGATADLAGTRAALVIAAVVNATVGATTGAMLLQGSGTRTVRRGIE